MVTSGELVIRGPCKAVAGIRNSRTFDVVGASGRIVDVAWALLDHKSLENYGEVTCLRIFKEPDGLAGLVLVKSGDGRSYIRIGIFTVRNKEQEEWWEDASEETLIIV